MLKTTRSRVRGQVRVRDPVPGAAWPGDRTERHHAERPLLLEHPGHHDQLRLRARGRAKGRIFCGIKVVLTFDWIIFFDQ